MSNNGFIRLNVWLENEKEKGETFLKDLIYPYSLFI